MFYSKFCEFTLLNLGVLKYKTRPHLSLSFWPITEYWKIVKECFSVTGCRSLRYKTTWLVNIVRGRMGLQRFTNTPPFWTYYFQIQNDFVSVFYVFPMKEYVKRPWRGVSEANASQIKLILHRYIVSCAISSVYLIVTCIV